MRRIFVQETNRADISPLTPVCKALGEHRVWSPDADIAVVLGDQAATLRAVIDLTQKNIPIAHIHGGEATFGSYDNQIRDAITKLSHIHFVAHEKYAERVRALGEKNVYVVGAPGIENIESLPRERNDLPPYFVATYHPVTLANEDVSELVEALAEFDHKVIWTPPNSDPGWKEIADAIGGTASLSLSEYLLFCHEADAVIGNSSSGIIEVPSLGTPTVNVGRRQEGRIRGPSVIDCEMDREDIVRAISEALVYQGTYDNPYRMEGTSENIVKVLLNTPLDGILEKTWST